MKVFTIALPLVLSGLLVAQTTPPAASQDDFKLGPVTTHIVLAPVLVTDNAGNIIDGLQPPQFHLFDNGKEQNIKVDVTYEPISMVIAMECSGRLSDSILKQMKHLGSLTRRSSVRRVKQQW